MSSTQGDRRFVAGNWKMNLNFDEGVTLAKAVQAGMGKVNFPVVFCTPGIHLAAVGEVCAHTANLHLGGQDVSAHASGAHTGEISAAQLSSVGCTYTIIGHSERRASYGESGQILVDKINQALGQGIQPIYCFGETLAEREAGNEQQIVAHQLSEGLAQLSAEDMGKVVLAYEPVWAIGTGKTASPEQAQEMHAFIRGWLTENFNADTAAQTSILYGGSVKPANAAELFSKPDIDGGLIGGASLKADDFLAIIAAQG